VTRLPKYCLPTDPLRRSYHGRGRLSLIAVKSATQGHWICPQRDASQDWHGHGGKGSHGCRRRRDHGWCRINSDQGKSYCCQSLQQMIQGLWGKCYWKSQLVSWADRDSEFWISSTVAYTICHCIDRAGRGYQPVHSGTCMFCKYTDMCNCSSKHLAKLRQVQDILAERATNRGSPPQDPWCTKDILVWQQHQPARCIQQR